MVKEENTTGANYIITFYNDIQNLTHCYAQYMNLRVEIGTKIIGGKGITPTENETIGKAVQALRYYANKTQISYYAIAEEIGEPQDTRILDSYVHIKEEYIINALHAEIYVKLLNSFLLKKIMKNLLETSQELIKKAWT